MDPQGPVALTRRLPVFDGYPYLVTALVAALHHYIALPGELARDELLTLARRQYAANRLRTCLVLGPDEALYVADEGESAGEAPRCTFPISDRLLGPDDYAVDPGLQVREKRLRAFVEASRAEGEDVYLIDRLRGRPATVGELVRLAGSDGNGVPAGLSRCGVCWAYRGECLPSIKQPGLVVPVYCRCENHNRCARCLGVLFKHRLDASYFDEHQKEVLHVAAFCGLDHRCTQPIGW